MCSFHPPFTWSYRFPAGVNANAYGDLLKGRRKLTYALATHHPAACC